MAHERFDHSYKHCKSTDCKLKDDCALHLAYLEAVGLKMQNIDTMEHCPDTSIWYTKVTIGENLKKNHDDTQ